MVGLPIAMNLQKMNATVTLIHKQVKNLFKNLIKNSLKIY